MYAVIQTGGKQYRVAPGDTIRIERVDGKVGEKVNFGAVLAVHTDDKKVVVGAEEEKVPLTAKICPQAAARSLPCSSSRRAISTRFLGATGRITRPCRSAILSCNS